FSGADGLRLVSLRALGHRAETVVSIADGFEYCDFAFRSRTGRGSRNESKRVLQRLNCLPIGKSSCSRLSRQHPLLHTFLVCMTLLEMHRELSRSFQFFRRTENLQSLS